MQEGRKLTCCWCGTEFSSEWHEASCCSGECYDIIANADSLLAAKRKRFRKLSQELENLEQRIAKLDSRIRPLVDRLRMLGRKWTAATPRRRDLIAEHERKLSFELAILNDQMDALAQEVPPSQQKIKAVEGDVEKLKKVVEE
jgi:chromosome segregation ATPase